MRINVAIDPAPCGDRAGAETAEWVKMAEDETPLEMCERHLAEAEVRVARHTRDLESLRLKLMEGPIMRKRADPGRADDFDRQLRDVLGTKHSIASTDTAASKDRPRESVALVTEQRAAIQD